MGIQSPCNIQENTWKYINLFEWLLLDENTLNNACKLKRVLKIQ